MSKRKGSGLIWMGIILFLIGYLLQSKINELLLDFIGFGLIGLGIVLGIVGCLKMISNGTDSER